MCAQFSGALANPTPADRTGPPPPPLSLSRPLIEAATHVVVALISVFAIKTSQDKGKPTVADGENIHARPPVGRRRRGTEGEERGG